MKTTLQLSLVLLLAFAGNLVFSQNEGKKWYFGNHAGLDFSTTPPTILTNGALTTSEGCSSISDFNGNLLFYTDGITVYDQTHAVMANGNGLFGNGSSTQSGVIVKQPGSSTIYYVFTVEATALTNGLRYSVVDMSLAAGMGSVTVKNVPLFTPSTEKITGVRHCNGVDIWVVSHDYNTNDFRTYLVTSAGVNTTPVISSVGTVHGGNSGVTVGALKISPNGKKLGICMSNVLNAIELYDFDNTTGIVSNLLALGTINGIYGCEFSPDGTKFYGSPWAANKIYQWDLCAGSGAAIIASQQTLTASNCGQMQLAPDGKIYMARSGASDLGVVNNPNAAGTACNYVNIGQSIAPKTSTWGLPNFITSFLATPFTYTQACSTASFTPPPTPTVSTSGCSAVANSVTSQSWIFGDPSSGTANTSTVANPTHNYAAPGTYTVQLVRVSTCGTDTIKVPVTISSSTLSFNAAPSVTQANCTSTVNAFNLGLSFGNPAPTYTISWNIIPYGVTSSTQFSSTGGIAAGVYNATIAVAGGCFKSTSFTINPGLGTLDFTVTPINVITCLQPTLTVAVDPAYQYTWTSLSAGPFTGASQVFTGNNVGTWTLTGANGGGCTSTTTFVVSQSTLTPTSSVLPNSQNITCNLSSISTVSATANPSVNITQVITDPQGGIFSANSYTTLYVPVGTGIYTHCAVNSENGCRTCKTFTVTSNQGFPTFSVVSAQNFTLGCTTKSVATINIVNGATTPTAGGPVSYTLLGPPTTTAIQGGTLSVNSTYTVNIPGTYTAITIDNTSLCQTRSSISILSNTFVPDIGAMVPQQTLSCDVPQVVLQGQSLTHGVSYNWGFPPTSGPGNVAGYSLSVGINTVLTTSTLVANYTLTVTENNNTCKSTSVIPVYQNVFLPKAIITNGGVSGVSCKTPTVMLTNVSTTGIPPGTFPTNLPPIGYFWEGPTPQEPIQLSTTYLAATPGEYTITVKDLNNGCKSTGTITIADNRIFPILNNPVSAKTPFLDCGAKFTKVAPIVTNVTSGLTYSWTAPASASVSGADTPTLTTDLTGDYKVLVTNTVTGCASVAYMIVESGTLTARFVAQDTSGHAPLEVHFTNTSASTLDTANIYSVWSFGNGTSSVTTAAGKPLTAIYKFPGTFTVTAFVRKGECLDTVMHVIHVDIPSFIEVPNVFTPNNDGVNDLFFLRATNLATIKILICDRWGHTIYELNSETGNISWDGKNQYGKDVAAGVYLYYLTATGSDGETYKKQGNISVFR